MTMSRAVSEIDRLIEEGLSLYGEGDLDGALLLPQSADTDGMAIFRWRRFSEQD